jgi:alpha-tubulin suppressor-like RCC1 family protein
LLPKNDETKSLLEKNEIHTFGQVPENLRNHIINLNKHTNSYIKKIVFGDNHCLILMNNSELFGFGDNENGQLGVNIKKDNNYINDLLSISLSLPDIKVFEILDIAAGNNFSLVLIKHKQQTLLIRLGIKEEDKYKSDLDQVFTAVKISLIT